MDQIQQGRLKGQGQGQGQGEMAERIRQHPWEHSPLGPMQAWPAELKTTIGIMLSAPQPMMLAWGPARTMLYNDAYAPRLGQRHPSVLGLPLPEAWPDVWPEIGPLTARVFAGEGMDFIDMPLLSTRSGYPEDTWWTFSLSPVWGEGGKVAGMLNVCLETTARVIAERERDAAQTVLSAEEEKFRSLFDAIDEGLAIVETIYDDRHEIVDMVFRQVNGAYERQAGLHDVVGRSLRDMLPGVEAAWLDRFRQVARTGEPIRVEDYQRDLDRWFDVYFSRVDQDGRFVAIVFNDITARKRAEQADRDNAGRQQFLLMLGDAVRAESRADKKIKVAARLLGERLRASRILWAEYDWQKKAAHIFNGWFADGAQPFPTVMQLDDYDGEVLDELRAGRTVRVDDVSQRTDEPAYAAIAAVGVQALLSPPLIVDGTLKLNLSVHQHEPRHWTDAEVALVHEVAERLWAEVVRARAEAALRDSEQRFQSLFDASPVPFMVLAPDAPGFTVTAANQAYYAATSTTAETLIGRCLFDVFPGDPERPEQRGAAALEVSLDKVLSTRRSDAMERVRYDIVTPEGVEPHWWAATNAPLLDASGNITAIIHQAYRVTELHYAELAERENQERQSFLATFSDVLRSEPTEAAVAQSAIGMLADQMNLDRCYITTYRPDDDMADMTFQTGNESVPPLPATVQLSNYPDAYEQVKGRTFVVDDDLARHGLSDDERAASRRLGMRAMVASTARQGENNPLISLAAVSSRVRHWTAGEVALVEEAAERTWAAMDRARSEAALRESEKRFRQFGDATQDILWIRDAETLQWQYLTPAFETIYGMSCEEALAGNDMRNWLQLIVPDDRSRAAENLQRVQAGEQVTFDFRIRRPVDGAIRWLRNTDFPITDDSGKVVMIGGIGHDATDLREAEQRLATLIEGIPQLVWRAVDHGRWTWASPQWTDYTGQAEQDSHGMGWLDCVHADDREAAMTAWSHAMETGGFSVEYRLCRADGSHRWFSTRATPVRDDDGTIVEWLGTSTDIQSLHELQERQRILLAELQHRVRNIMAMIRSIARRTAEGAENVADYIEHFEGRINAMARTQTLLTRAPGAGVDLQNLVRDELEAQAAKPQHYTCRGPDVALSSKAAEVLTLAVHELATNAVKYGALGIADGLVTIEWTREERAGQAWLCLSWTELRVTLPADLGHRKGFGTELVTRRVPYELKGRGTMEFRPTGLHARIEFPLVPGQSILQTDAGAGIATLDKEAV